MDAVTQGKTKAGKGKTGGKSDARAAYYDRISKLDMAPLWVVLKDIIPEQPKTVCAPAIWRYKDVRPYVSEAGSIITAEEATRRVLVLENPLLRGKSRITQSLYAGLQLILPGEVAPSHRHTQSALRFIVEGEGAYTAVDGERTLMREGDFVITPTWTWHDHGNESVKPMVWLDGLDIPMVRAFAASWVSPTRPARAPAPASDAEQAAFRWAWRDTRRVLEGLAATSPRDKPVTRAYVTLTGAPPLPTMGADAHWLRPGERARAGRSTASRVFHVIEGHGGSRIGDTELTWERGDTFVAPSWHWIEHDNGSAAEPACLFSFNDEPAIRALGLWHEERPAAR